MQMSWPPAFRVAEEASSQFPPTSFRAADPSVRAETGVSIEMEEQEGRRAVYKGGGGAEVCGSEDLRREHVGARLYSLSREKQRLRPPLHLVKPYNVCPSPLNLLVGFDPLPPFLSRLTVGPPGVIGEIFRTRFHVHARCY